jgi:hypothetical protein
MRKVPINRAVKSAQRVLEACGLDHPLEIPLEDIALSRGVAAVQAVPIRGAQGRIIMDGEDAIISYDSKIEHEGKRRFVIAHELGHYELHKGILDKIHTDDDKSLNEWYAKGSHEQEANSFAAELLMPSGLFIDQVKGRKFDFDLVRQVADYFGASLTATLLKYRLLGDFPIAIVFCENGKVNWLAFSDDFVLKFIKIGSDIPINSVAYDFFAEGKLPDEPEIIDAEDWFEEDFNCKRYRDIRFYEQCMRIGKTGILSCIWND